MTSIDEIYSGNSLKSADLKGREPTVTIKAVEPREFKNKDGRVQSKLVIGFEGTPKTFVCNKTNANRIALNHGKDYTNWIGKKITLYVDPYIEFGGEVTEGIRVRPPITQAKPAPTNNPASDISDDIPF